MIDGVHVWRAALDGAGWPPAAGLPAAERERAAELLRPEAARRWIASRWALRTVLSRYLDVPPAEIELELGAQGKPRLRSNSGLEFNLSHSEGRALVAVAGRPVGVDIEAIRPGRDVLALAERALPAEDVAALEAAPTSERTAVFYRAWARYEAQVKCFGTGIGRSPSATRMALADLDVPAGYAAAVAVAANEVGPVASFDILPYAMPRADE